MFYRYSLAVPASTPATTPVSITMHLSHGIVHQVEIGFPQGCAGLVHVSLWRYEHQAWPTNPDHQFAWDDYNVRITNEAFGLTTQPYTLSLRAWSEDTAFPHTITCRIGVRRPDLHRPGSWVGRLLRGESGDRP